MNKIFSYDKKNIKDIMKYKNGKILIENQLYGLINGSLGLQIESQEIQQMKYEIIKNYLKKYRYDFSKIVNNMHKIQMEFLQIEIDYRKSLRSENILKASIISNICDSIIETLK